MGNCVKVWLFGDLVAIFRNQMGADEYISVMSMMKGLPVSAYATAVAYVPNAGF
jgi:hypothetical protein